MSLKDKTIEAVGGRLVDMNLPTVTSGRNSHFYLQCVHLIGVEVDLAPTGRCGLQGCCL